MYFLCLFQSRLAGGGILFYTCAFVCLSVRSSVHPYVTKLVSMVFWKWMSQFWCILVQMVHGTMGWNGRLWGSRSHGQTRPKIDLEAWRRHSWPPWVEWVFLWFLLINYSSKWMSLSVYCVALINCFVECVPRTTRSMLSEGYHWLWEMGWVCLLECKCFLNSLFYSHL